MLKLGGGMLEELLAADPRLPRARAPCGQGHEAEFVAHRDKTFDTVLGPVTIPAPGTTARSAGTAWRRRDSFDLCVALAEQIGARGEQGSGPERCHAELRPGRP